MYNPNENLEEFSMEQISKLSSDSALTLSIVLVVLAIIKLFVLEGFLLKTVYKSAYSGLNDHDHRSFINHHITGATKLVALLTGLYPYIAVISGHATLKSSASKGSLITMSDIFIVAAQMLVGAYIFELIYRPKLSIVATLHHIGSITIGEVAVVLAIWQGMERASDLEYLVYLAWGTSAAFISFASLFQFLYLA
jgi:hypothetical protein